MNNKNVEAVENERFPYLPKLTGIKTTRVITKHFTNLSMYLSPDHYNMLSWLIYQSRNDNTVVYSMHLMRKYRDTVLAAADKYGSEVHLKCGINSNRDTFKWLISEGYLFCAPERLVYMINPLLTYRAEYIRSEEYNKICDRYQHIWFGTNRVNGTKDLVRDYMNIINKRIKDKKKKSC